MKTYIKENNAYKIFIFIALFICPLTVLAPLGSWIPLVLSAVIVIFFLKGFFTNFQIDSLSKILIFFFIWIILNSLFIGQSFVAFEKALHFIIILISGVILSKLTRFTNNFNKIIIYFSVSLLFSILIIIIDYKTNLGFKLWLSKNLDFENFKNFYQLKTWISFNDFRNNHYELIATYLANTYDRGIIALVILSLPLAMLCYIFEHKVIAFLVFIMVLTLPIFIYNLTVIISFFIALFLATLFYFNKYFFQKYFLYFLGLYFLFTLFVLGSLDYKKYSVYENTLVLKQQSLVFKVCDDNNSNMIIYIKCNNKEAIGSFIADKNTLKPSMLKTHSDSLQTFIKYKSYIFVDQMLHRLIIWSYVKENIFKKPIFGHGFSSSRIIGNNMSITENKTQYQLIPLHPHNSILQIWLELGFIGIIIFFIFIKILFKKIYDHSKYNHKVSTMAVISFFQIFIIGQISYGFWQSWWIAVILINFILYSLMFKYSKSHQSSLN